jgi:hypothetical protein
VIVRAQREALQRRVQGFVREVTQIRGIAMNAWLAALTARPRGGLGSSEVNNVIVR